MNSALIAILSCSITMSVVTVLALLFSPVLEKRYSSRSLYALWAVVLACYLLPVRIPLPQRSVITVELPQALNQPVRLSPVPSPDLARESMRVGAEESSAVPAVQIRITPTQILSAIYLIGAFTTLFMQLARHRRFAKTMKRWQRRVTDRATLEVYDRVCSDMAIRRAPALYRSAAAASPMLIGFLRPRIILPKQEPFESALDLILRHELTHYRRHDLHFRILMLLARTIHWFNPVVYLCERAAVYYGELSCDEYAVSMADKDRRAAYSNVILAALRSNSSAQSLLTTSFSMDKKLLKRRLIATMNMNVKKHAVFVAVIALMLSVVLGAHLVFAESANGAAMETDPDSGIDPSISADADDLLESVAKLYDDNGPYDTWTIGTYQQAVALLVDAGILADESVLYQYGDTQNDMRWALLDALPGVSSHFITRVAVALWGDRTYWTQQQQFQHTQLLEAHGILTEYNTAYTVPEIDEDLASALKQQAMTYMKQHHGIDLASRSDIDVYTTMTDGKTYSFAFRPQGFDDIMVRINMDESGEVVDLYMNNEVIDEEREAELYPDRADLPDWTLEQQAEYAALWMYPEYGMPGEGHISKEDALSIAERVLAENGATLDADARTRVSFVIAGLDDTVYPYWRIVYQRSSEPYQSLASVRISADTGEVLYLNIMDYSKPGLG